MRQFGQPILRLLAALCLTAWMAAQHHDSLLAAIDVAHHHPSGETHDHDHHVPSPGEPDDQHSIPLPDTHSTPFSVSSGSASGFKVVAGQSNSLTLWRILSLLRIQDLDGFLEAPLFPDPGEAAPRTHRMLAFSVQANAPPALY